MTAAFDPSKEPLRALRDLIVACENCSFFGPDFEEASILERARVGFDALRALFGDTRPADTIGDREQMIEPALVPEIANTGNLDGALQFMVEKEGAQGVFAALQRCLLRRHGERPS